MSTATAGGGGAAGPAAPPSSAGATSGSQESIAHKLHLPWWPQGDTGRLRDAARAYRACATALTDAAEQGQRGISDITGHNTAAAVEAIGTKWSGTYYGRACLAAPSAGAPAFDNAITTCGLLAQACEDYAQHIDDAKHRLEELAAELVAGLVIGGLLTFVTAGLSDAAAAANAARVLTLALELADTVGTYVTIAFRVGGLAIQGALVGAGSDLAMQTVRITLNPQTSFSFGELAQATEFGALLNPAFAGGAAALTRLPALFGARSIGTTLDELTTVGRTPGALTVAGTDAADATATASNGLRTISAADLATQKGLDALTKLPPLTNITYKAFTFTTDAEGRLAKVVGPLTLGAGDKLPAKLASEIRALGTTGDQAGHFIAKIFEGPPTRFNLLPQNGNLNMGRFRVMEKGWADALNQNPPHTINVQIEAVYEGGITRPAQYIIEWTDNGVPHTKVFDNGPATP